MSRDLSDEEIEWLEDAPIGESHAVEGGTNLAACSDCDWQAQADTFDYLMEQVTMHLEETYQPLTLIQRGMRVASFISRFGWDPWADGVLTDEDFDSHTFDVLAVTESDADGNLLNETLYACDMDEDDE